MVLSVWWFWLWGHPLQEEEVPHPEDAPGQGHGHLPRGGDTAGQARVHHDEDFCLRVSYISQWKLQAFH